MHLCGEGALYIHFNAQRIMTCSESYPMCVQLQPLWWPTNAQIAVNMHRWRDREKVRPWEGTTVRRYDRFEALRCLTYLCGGCAPRTVCVSADEIDVRMWRSSSRVKYRVHLFQVETATILDRFIYFKFHLFQVSFISSFIYFKFHLFQVSFISSRDCKRMSTTSVGSLVELSPK